MFHHFKLCSRVMVNKSPNINSTQLNSNQKIPMTYSIENYSPGFGQQQKCGRIKSDNQCLGER